MRRSRLLPSVLCLVLQLVCLAAGLVLAADEVAAASRRVRVTDGELGRRLTTAGARLVGDYGAFQILDVDAATAAGLAARDGVEVVPDHDAILLNTGPLRTGPAAAAGRRALAGAFTGKRLHLIQFAGRSARPR